MTPTCPPAALLPCLTSVPTEFHTNLTVAIASQLRDEAHVVLADLNHLLADVVLWAARYRCTGPPVGGGRQGRQEGEAEGQEDEL